MGPPAQSGHGLGPSVSSAPDTPFVGSPRPECPGLTRKHTVNSSVGLKACVNDMQPNQLCRKGHVLLGGGSPHAASTQLLARCTERPAIPPGAGYAQASLPFCVILGHCLRWPSSHRAEKGLDDVLCVRGSVDGPAISVGFGGPQSRAWPPGPSSHARLARSNV